MSSQLPDKFKEKVFIASGSTHPELAQSIADNLGVPLGEVALRQFPNTDPYVRYLESVRGRRVFVIQPHAPINGRSTSDSFREQIELMFAAFHASAKKITAVSPNLAGARQDRKSQGRESISSEVVLRTMREIGHAKRLVTVDPHSPQSLSAFEGKRDVLTAQDLLRDAFQEKITGNPDEYLLIAPDSGRSKLTERLADALSLDMEIMPKKRDKDNNIVRRGRVPDVEGRTCLMVDDIIDTAGTIVSAAEMLHAAGAREIFVAATHGWFSNPAIPRLKDSPIDQVIVTDTVPLHPEAHELGDRLRVLQAGPMIAQALKEIIIDGSVSSVFDGKNYS